MNNIVTNESGFNIYAKNRSSGAYGLCQALPAEKMATFGENYLTSPHTQIRWCLDYVARRYRTPTEAWSFWLSQTPHWY